MAHTHTTTYADIPKDWALFDAYPARRFRKIAILEAIELHDHVRIETEHGWVVAEPGDFLARGPDGEFYPITAQRIRETYEEIVPHG